MWEPPQGKDSGGLGKKERSRTSSSSKFTWAPLCQATESCKPQEPSLREAGWEEQWENRKPHGARKKGLSGHKTGSVQAPEKAGEGKDSNPAKRGVGALLHQGHLCCVQAGLGLAGSRGSLPSQPSRTRADSPALLENGSLALQRDLHGFLEAPQSLPWPCHTLRHERALPEATGDILVVLPPLSLPARAQHHGVFPFPTALLSPH